MAKKKEMEIFKVPELRSIDPTKSRELTMFLNTLASCGQISRSARASQLRDEDIKELQKKYPLFAAMMEHARDHYRDRLRQAINRRAIDGIEEPVYYQGVMVGTVRKYSDRLLEFAAKAHCPEYREKSAGINVNSGVLVIQAPRQSHAEWLEQQLREEQACAVVQVNEDQEALEATSVKVLE